MADEAEGDVSESGEVDIQPEAAPDDVSDPVEESAPDSEPLADPNEQTEESSEADVEPQAKETNAAPVLNAPSVQTIAMAARLGLDPHEIAEYQSEEELSRTVKLMTRRFQSQEKDSGPKTQKADEFSIESFPMPDPDSVSEDVIKWATAVKDFVGKLSEHTQRSVGAVHNGLSQREQIMEERDFESSLSSLTDSEKLFGKGSARSLKKAGKNSEFNNRVKLFGAMKNYMNAAAQRGEEVDMDEALAAAFQVAFPRDAGLSARQEIAKQVEKRKGMMSSAPNGRNAKTPSDPDERAKQAIAQWRAEKAEGKAKKLKK